LYIKSLKVLTVNKIRLGKSHPSSCSVVVSLGYLVGETTVRNPIQPVWVFLAFSLGCEWELLKCIRFMNLLQECKAELPHFVGVRRTS
jgi:hypothetical protein